MCQTISLPWTNTSEGSERAPLPWQARILALATVTVALAALGHAMGLGQIDSFSALQTTIHGAGALGAIAYLALFVFALQMQAPGALFLVGALLLWGPVEGALIGWLGAMLSLATHFAVTRSVGGSPLSSMDNRLVRALLARLERRPVAVTAALRVAMLLSPPLSIGLILSGVRFRDYMLGSAIGLAIPIAAAAIGFDVLEPWLLSMIG